MVRQFTVSTPINALTGKQKIDAAQHAGNARASIICGNTPRRAARFA
jgi:hypothetical protein